MNKEKIQNSFLIIVNIAMVCLIAKMINYHVNSVDGSNKKIYLFSEKEQKYLGYLHNIKTNGDTLVVKIISDKDKNTHKH